MPSRDPLRTLQAAARAAAEHVSPGQRARRVIVFGDDGGKLLDAAVPACPAGGESHAPPAGVPGWSVRDGRAYFDGTLVPITGRRLDVLRVLIEKEVATVDDLRVAWEPYRPEDGSVRWTVGELKKSLREAFGEFDGEIVAATGGGYQLKLR